MNLTVLIKIVLTLLESSEFVGLKFTRNYFLIVFGLIVKGLI